MTQSLRNSFYCWKIGIGIGIGICYNLLGHSQSRRASKQYYWFKSYGNFAELVDFSQWWSCIGMGLRLQPVFKQFDHPTDYKRCLQCMYNVRVFATASVVRIHTSACQKVRRKFSLPDCQGLGAKVLPYVFLWLREGFQKKRGKLSTFDEWQTKLKNSNCDKTQKLNFLQNSQT